MFLIPYVILLEHILSTSYDRAKHVVEVDERILAVFIVDSTGNISDLLVAETVLGYLYELEDEQPKSLF